MIQSGDAQPELSGDLYEEVGALRERVERDEEQLAAIGPKISGIPAISPEVAEWAEAASQADAQRKIGRAALVKTIKTAALTACVTGSVGVVIAGTVGPALVKFFHHMP